MIDHLIRPGTPTPLGATSDSAGVNFAVHSDIATAIWVCVFDEAGNESRHLLPGRKGSVHHGHLTGVGPGTRYGLRVDGPWAPARGLWCNPAKLLIDPYAAAVDGRIDWDRSVYGFSMTDPDMAEPHDSAPFAPRSVVVDHGFDWGDDRPPHRDWADTVIYETHVKNLTRLHPDVPEHLRGTYLGVVEPAILDHLVSLGVTAVELLPVTRFVHDHALVTRGQRNLWGYQPIAMLAPHDEYSTGAAVACEVTEMKEMVKRLHAAGLEVILDVVYNHTAESHHLGPNLSFRGIDNPAYYRLSDEDPRHYLDYAGTGNTVNLDHPATVRLVADSLRNWVERYHVDGFRFDLATTLGRSGLMFDPASPFFHIIAQDPVLNRVKLIAEPWDIGPGGYHLGSFPEGWHEWNDRYRAGIRDYWRGKPGILGDLATRLTGSADVFRPTRRPATASINYVTSHDGFTLTDLVSYDIKHNLANGEDNRDGSTDNRSWNSGVEGPTDDPDILALRRRRRRSLVTTLLVSQGVPMLLGGDEIGRSQGGNNNPYAQDNDISWYQWDDVDEEHLAFTSRVVALRRRHPALRRPYWLTGTGRAHDGLTDVIWLTPAGDDMTPADWETGYARAIGMYLDGEAVPPNGIGSEVLDDSFLLFFNAGDDPIGFSIPSGLRPEPWHVEIDTADPTVDGTATVADGESVAVESYAMVVLRQPRPRS